MVAKLTKTAKRIYRKRVSKSPCRGKSKLSCKSTNGCIHSKGKKRSFCRKTKNTKRNMFAAFRVTRRR